MEELSRLYSRFRNTPFPKLGRGVGDFVMFDSVFAAFYGKAIGGPFFPADDVPSADSATTRFVETLRQKDSLTDDEREFMEYFDLMEKITQFYLQQRRR